MAKIAIAGNAVVITSTLKLADIKKVQKSTRKDALTLKGGEDGKTPIFMVGAVNFGEGRINNVGAEFACESRDENKFAQITLNVDPDVPDVKEAVVDKLGVALVNLAKIEESIPAVLGEINAEHEALVDSIEVVG